MERSGAAVRLVPCGALNFKVTRPEDAVVAGLLAGGEGKEGEAMREMRVGQGFDNHRLCSGRRLVLGGVEIPFELGLDGHSDADALLHALTDAVLGAAGLGDIGEHFPPSDMRWKGADSRELLGQVMREVRAAGWEVVNADATVLAERPKLAAWKPRIRESVARALGIDPARVNIKAKTKEGQDSVGEMRSIEAQAAVLLERVR